MKKIILASNSPQRKKLLRQAGLRFQTLQSNVKEATRLSRRITTIEDLVKYNALLKAGGVSDRVDEGIVIGADTVVSDGERKIIGKPHTLKDARTILKQLSAKPHWVYTGVAVIDRHKDRTQVMVDVEKTKIMMNPLSRHEMKRYHQKINPFDKAGGFDIEGTGAVFIKGIEGCYTNVIGLPMAKLRLMLKRMGISLLGLFFVSFWSGCATEFNLATGQEETMLYSTEREVAIGDAVARQFEEHYAVISDVDVNERVEKILNKIIEVCDRKELIYSIKVVDEDKLNAVSLPGGYVYLFKKILDEADNDDQLAGVIAHEVGHITAKHGMKKLQAIYGYTLLQILAVGTRNPQVVQGVSLAYQSLFYEYSQEDEFQADKLAVKYMKKAGYDPLQMVAFLKKLKEEQERAPLQPLGYWRTHPHIAERIAVSNTEATGELNFRDYLNITVDDQ